MNHFLAGFVDELEKVGAAASSPEVIRRLAQMTPASLKRFGVNATALAAMQKLINPDSGIGEALATGGAIEGGSMVGRRVGSQLGFGRGGRLAASLGGAVLAARLLHKSRANERKEKARATLYGNR